MNISDRNVDIDDRYMNIGDRNVDIDDRYMNIGDRDVDVMYENIDAIVQSWILSTMALHSGQVFIKKYRIFPLLSPQEETCA